jgi:steroid 5-alpha reductase family enzyme
MMIPRGGASAVVSKSIDLLTTSLQSGPWGVVGLWAVSSAVVVPFTLYRQGFSFSVGYGYSVMAMSMVLAKVFHVDPLLCAAIFYGARLGSYLLFRNIVSPKKAQQTKSFDKTFPRIKRVPFAASVALFYAFLMTPALYAMRLVATTTATTTSMANQFLKVGTIVAWVGAVLEAVADGQKLMAKSSPTPANIDDDDEVEVTPFVGPTSGVYRLTRHPNYTGELIFWFGLLVAGIPSFGKSPIAWICSLLGMYGIYGIMTNATKRLDSRQLENYGGQESYDTWRAQVKASIFPFVNAQ